MHNNTFPFHPSSEGHSAYSMLYSLLKEEWEMGSCGCGENQGYVGGMGTSTAAILVLFILLVIITKSFWL
jgi:uncharacterized protein (TIGR01732 family)